MGLATCQLSHNPTNLKYNYTRIDLKKAVSVGIPTCFPLGTKHADVTEELGVKSYSVFSLVHHINVNMNSSPFITI